MSKIKKSLLYCLSMLLAFSFLISPLPNPAKNKKSTAVTNEIQVVDNDVLNYVTISTAGLVLTPDKLKNIDTDDDGKTDTSLIIANGTISLNFKPFEYNYTATFNSSYFYKSTFETSLEKDADGKFPDKFTYKNSEVSYQVSQSNVYTFSLKDSNKTVSSELSEFIDVEETETTRKFIFTTCYTLKAEAPNTPFKFTLGTQTNPNANVTEYSLVFERPISNFKTVLAAYS